MKRVVSFVIAIIMVLMAFSACSPFDPEYGTRDEKEPNVYKNVKIPEIKSDDEKMPTFFDISLFDEENYSDIYLGKKFEFKVTYAGSELNVPCTLSDMEKMEWSIAEGSSFNIDSQILAGKSAKVNLSNKYGKQIVAVFFNSSKSSDKIEDCDIVKFIVPENLYDNNESVYGQFFVNGVSNESAITDVIEYLGAPSHFYAVNENLYYLDYFITPKDKRNGITVYVDLSKDSVTSVEFSHY